MPVCGIRSREHEEVWKTVDGGAHVCLWATAIVPVIVERDAGATVDSKRVEEAGGRETVC